MTIDLCAHQLQFLVSIGSVLGNVQIALNGGLKPMSKHKLVAICRAAINDNINEDEFNEFYRWALAARDQEKAEQN